MWKNTSNEIASESNPISTPAPVHRQPIGEQAVIGSSLIVKGDVLGEEDLMIQGQIEGKVVLKKNSITVGKNGRVKADLFGKIIVVEGVVQGNLFGEEKVIVRKSGDVRGNLTAPRINLEEGAKFKGSIDMEGDAAPDRQRPLPGAAVTSGSRRTETGKAVPGGKKEPSTSNP